MPNAIGRLPGDEIGVPRYVQAISVVCLLVALTLAIGCGKDDHPNELQPRRQAPPPPSFALGYEQVMEFTVGVFGRYAFEPSVPEPGEPVLTVEGLPARALFEDDVLSWTPAAEDGVGEAGRTYRVFRLRFTLGSTAEEESFVHHKASIIVHGAAGEGA